MSMRHQMRRHHVRTLVALAAAYAVALQALLLAVGGPFAGVAKFTALPICSGAGHSAPANRGDCCPGLCLGCCCGPPICPARGPALPYAPAPQQAVAATFATPPRLPVRATGAHRSRAPPLPA